MPHSQKRVTAQNLLFFLYIKNFHDGHHIWVEVMYFIILNYGITEALRDRIFFQILLPFTMFNFSIMILLSGKIVIFKVAIFPSCVPRYSQKLLAFNTISGVRDTHQY